MTEFRNVADFPGYQVGEDGSVLSFLSCSAFKLLPGEFRNLSVNHNKHGHCFVRLRKDGKSIKKYVHRLVLEAFVGPCPERMECRHLDNNPMNNNLRNLAWGTKAENEADKIGNQTTNRVERNGMSKLTVKEVEEIRARYAAGGMSQLALGKEYGVSDGTVCNIVQNKSWTSPAFPPAKAPVPNE